MSEKDIIWSSGVYNQSTIDTKKMLNVMEINGVARKSPGGPWMNGPSSPV